MNGEHEAVSEESLAVDRVPVGVLISSGTKYLRCLFEGSLEVLCELSDWSQSRALQTWSFLKEIVVCV